MIDEAKRELTLSDERIEKAITQNGARLIILCLLYTSSCREQSHAKYDIIFLKNFSLSFSICRENRSI